MKNNKENLNSSYLYYICIKEKDCEGFKGEIYPTDTDTMIVFETFEDFIMKMDLYMDEHGPQSFQDKRSLTDSTSKSHFVLPKHGAKEKMEGCFSCMDTYDLYIFSRRNTEWQGALYQENNKLLEFSNIIDLTNFFADLG